MILSQSLPLDLLHNSFVALFLCNLELTAITSLLLLGYKGDLESISVTNILLLRKDNGDLKSSAPFKAFV